MGAFDPLQLETVFQQAQELIGLDEVVAVLPTDIPLVDQHLQRLHGGAHPERFIVTAVHHLQQLDGELNIPQPATTEFELAVAQLLRHVLQDTPAHGLHIIDEGLPLAGGPHHGADRIEICLPQVHVTGHGAGLEQRLELPGLRPPLVVGDMRLQGPNKSAALALRAQRRVHLEE